MRIKVERNSIKLILLALSIFILTLAVTSTFAYSIPLSWVRNATGGPVDVNDNGIIDRSEIITNISSGLSITSNQLSITQGEGVLTEGNLSIDPELIEALFASLTTNRSEKAEIHQGIETIEPEGSKEVDVLVNNDTYRNSTNSYNFVKWTSSPRLYPGSVQVEETYIGVELVEGLNYTIDYCKGKINLTDVNTTAGNNETIAIRYYHAPDSLTGNKTDGIFRTEHNPVLKGTVSLTSSGTQLEEGKCKDYTVLNYRTGKIKLWRFNRTEGSESVNISYNWTSLSDEVYWNSTTQSLEIKEEEIDIGEGLLEEKGDTMTGDLNMSGNAIRNTSSIGIAGDVLKLGGNLNISSRYIINTPSTRSVINTYLKGYWPAEKGIGEGNPVFDWSKSSNDGKWHAWNTEAVWKMDHGSGSTMFDETVNENHGILKDNDTSNADGKTLPEWVEGKSGKALRFDGVDDYVEVPDSDSLDLEEGFTVEGWIRHEGSDSDQNIITKENAYKIAINSSNFLKWALYTDGDWEWHSGVSIPTGEWHHVAFLYNGSHGIFYKDGARESVVADPDGGKIDRNDNDVWFGRANDGGSSWLNGALDEFAIYSKELSSSEIQKHYNTGEAYYIPKGKGIVGLAANFSEGRYNSILGHVTESNTATLSAWVKADDLNNNQTAISIGDYIEVKPIIGGGKGYAAFYDGGRMKLTEFNDSIEKDKWHHITYVLDNNQQTLYIDGVKDSISNHKASVGFNKDKQLNTLFGASWSEDWPYTDTWTVSNSKDWRSAREEDKDTEVFSGALEIERVWWILSKEEATVYQFNSSFGYTGRKKYLGNQDLEPSAITRDEGGDWWMVGDKNNSVHHYDSDWIYKDEKYNISTEDKQPTEIFQDNNKNWRILGNENDEVYKYNSTWGLQDSVDISGQATDPRGIFQGREDNIWRLLGDSSNKVYEYETLGAFVKDDYPIGDDNSLTSLYQDGEGNWWITGTENDKVYKYDSGFNLKTSYDVSNALQNPQDLHEEVPPRGNWTSIWYDWEEWVLPNQLRLWTNHTEGNLQVRVQSTYNKSKGPQGDTGWMEIVNTGEVPINISELGKARYVRVMFNLTRGPPSPEVYNYTIEVRTQGKEEFWNGQLDEVRIYNKALSKNQVRTLYEKGRKQKQEIGGAWLSREGGKLQGNLDMNGNKIKNFFFSNQECDTHESITKIYPNGSYKCENFASDIIDMWVDETGDKMYGNLTMKTGQFNNNITGVQRLGINTTQPDYGALQINYEGDSSTISGTHPISIRGHDQALLLGADTDNTAGYLQSIDIGTDKSDLSLNPQGGNVGIGVTDPSTKLHVGGELLLPNDNYLKWGGKNVMKLDGSNNLVINGFNTIEMTSGHYYNFTSGDSKITLDVDDGFPGRNGNNNPALDMNSGEVTNIPSLDTLSGSATVDIGEGAWCEGTDAIAIGKWSHARGEYSIALGRSARAWADYSIALGYNTNATAEGAIALGPGTVADEPYTLEVDGDVKFHDEVSAENVRVDGSDTEEPFLIKTMTKLGDNINKSTGIDASKWDCSVGSWMGRDADVNENGGSTWKVFTVTYGGTWYVLGHIHTHYDHESWSVEIFCVREEWDTTDSDYDEVLE